ncbi:MAG: deoxyuridine 5'-triphosphate nucleotidohydrolase [Halobacteriaceae archaeon]
MFRAGDVVADHITPVTEEQIQPNGVDLTLAAVLEPRGAGYVGREGKTVADRDRIEPDTPRGDGPPSFHLTPGSYVLQYAETVTVPTEHIGLLFPRSTLLRNACTLDTAVWDPGYTGKGEGLLTVRNEIEIEAGARIGQFVLARAEAGGEYAGSYQRERTGSGGDSA